MPSGGDSGSVMEVSLWFHQLGWTPLAPKFGLAQLAVSTGAFPHETTLILLTRTTLNGMFVCGFVVRRMTMDEMHLRTFYLIRVEVEALKERHFERGSVDLQKVLHPSTHHGCNTDGQT